MHDTEQHIAGLVTRRPRNSREAPRWALLMSVGIGAVVLAVGLLAGTWGTASGASAQTSQRHRLAAKDSNDLTQGFTVYNNSSQTLRYDGYDSNDGGELEGGGPAKGTKVPPNKSMHFEHVYKFLTNTSLLIHFSVPSEPGASLPTFDFVSKVDIWNTWSGKVEDPTPASNLYVFLDGRIINVNNA